MHTAFRTRFESRGEGLNLMGDAVRDMSREELYAVIGFLLDVSDVDEIETQLGRYSPSRPSRGNGNGQGEITTDPPSNNGLFEG
jgi:hypothetical protein